ncbi:hypothetical protein D3C87_125280 [compost metagenome]
MEMASFDFEAPYNIYPRKGEGKTKGMAKLKKTIKKVEEYLRFLKAVENYTLLCKQNKTERQYIKHWSTFCNNWKDYENGEELGLIVVSSPSTLKPVAIRR